jgi:hypothetical protein
VRRAAILVLFALSDCKCRTHAPIVDETEPPPAAASATVDLSVAAALVARANAVEDLAGVRVAPPSEDELRAAIRPVTDAIARCVEHALPPVDAKPFLVFKVDPAGKLTDARVDGITGADVCVQQALGAVLTPIFHGLPAQAAVRLGRDGRPLPLVSDGGV